MPIVSFGSYDFTAAHVFLGDFEYNFTDLVLESSRLPGMSGVFDEYGRSSVAPNAKGTVKQELTLRTTSADMDDYRDALNAIATWGRQILTLEPDGYPTNPARFCTARVRRVMMKQRLGYHTRIHQPVTIEWEVADPRWLVNLSGGSLWGVGEWGSAVWGGAADTIAASGEVTDTQITYNGNVPAEVTVEIQTGASETCTNPMVQRVVNGRVVEQWRFIETLGNSETLRVDPRRHTVRLNHQVAYDDRFSYLTAGWLSLVPGEQTIRVVFNNSSDAATVKLFYYEAYR